MKRFAPANPLAFATLATVLVICLLQLTEAYDPPGSIIGWLCALVLAWAHLRLVVGRQSSVVGETTFPISYNADRPPITDRRPTTALSRFPALALILTAAAFLLWNASARLFESGIVPRASAQLGLASQVASRLGGPVPLYRVEYPRAGFSERNSFPVGATIPFAMARAYRWDWRAANIVGAAFLAAMLAAAVVSVGSREGALALAAMAAWLLLPRTADYLGWGQAAPLWPLIFALGASLAAGHALMAALLAGLLAASSVGWVLLAPAVLAAFWRSNRAQFPVLVAALIVPPLFAYGLARSEFHDVLKGILGGPFGEGRAQRSDSWRFATLHGVGDFFGLRMVVYVAGAAGIALVARRMISASDEERPRLFAAAAFLVVACAPVAHFFHWMAHAVLLAGLVAGSEAVRAPARAWTWRIAIAGATAAGLVWMLPLRAESATRALDLGSGRQRHDAFMLEGWNIESADHVWGRDKYLATGFVLSRPTDGLLELHFETLGGEFTPINPVVIRVNGIAKAVYRELPGRGSYALVRLAAEELNAGFNTVELECGWARTPVSYRVSTDTRRVSVMYRGMRFYAGRLRDRP